MPITYFFDSNAIIQSTRFADAMKVCRVGRRKPSAEWPYPSCDQIGISGEKKAWKLARQLGCEK